MEDRLRRHGLLILLALPATSIALAASPNAQHRSPNAPPRTPNAERRTPDGEYSRSIRPLFAARCIACHGPKVQRNGLRLDLKSAAMLGADSGPVLVPGKSAESELIRRVTSTDPKKVMPPAGPRLTPADVERLRAWVDSGAPWPDDPEGTAARSDHWAFQPIVRPTVPRVKDPAWVVNPIDAFVLSALEKKGIRPSPPADPVTLIRRVTLDLTGLPPTPEEVTAFVAERAAEGAKSKEQRAKGQEQRARGKGQSATGSGVRGSLPSAPGSLPGGAYNRLVDRLLASPQYGERWGRWWLDAARYADSNGYTIDSARSIWMYRDWVINALNADMPFDEFTVEQLAGDMLPNATQSQIIATGFHRNTLINEEGGTDPEQFRVEAVVDRVNTTGSAFLGLTVGCAQCHTHKFDPITQREYYQLLAFFNGADEPSLSFPTPEQARRQAELAAQLEVAQKQLAEYDADLPRHQAEWEQRVRTDAKIDWTVLTPAEFRSAGGATARALPDGSLLVGGQVPDQDTYSVTVDAPRGPISAIRLEALTDGSVPGGGPGFTPHGNFVLSEFEISAGPAGDTGQPLPLARARADYAQANMPVSAAIDGNLKTGWGVYAADGHQSRTAVFILGKPLVPPAGTRLTFRLKQLYSGPRYLIGRLRLSFTTAPEEAVDSTLAPALRQILALPPERRSKEQAATITAEFQKLDPVRAGINVALGSIQTRQKDLAKEIPSTMVMKERATPRESFLHIRGDFLRKGVRVQPGVPAVLPPLPRGLKNPTRLDLARWIIDPKNPLTSRVTANRVWQVYFGTGLVETENDFGRQGTPPSNPELLDWLATAFARGIQVSRYSGIGEPLEHGRPEYPNTRIPEYLPDKPWSLKALHRLIVLSNTYRQSSKARPDLQQVDPQNRLLARQSRLRLDAEGIRDVSLAASGLLCRKIGGPSVFPPQPAGLDLFTQTKKNWKPSEGEDRYRRGLYTFMWRSSPYAMFAAFDAPNGSLTCTRRGRSNTPLGALMLANDQSLFEMAQGLAARVMGDVPTSDSERVRCAFRRCLSREPTSAEAARLLEYYQSQVRAFQAAPKDAGAVAPKGRPEGFDVAQAAAWTSVARVLMNLDEFITRE